MTQPPGSARCLWRCRLRPTSCSNVATESPTTPNSNSSPPWPSDWGWRSIGWRRSARCDAGGRTPHDCWSSRILVARLLASSETMAYRLIVSPAFRASLPAQAAVVDSEAARIAAIPGPVVCDVPTVARRAGKPFVYDPFVIPQRIKAGRLTRAEADRRIAAAGIRFEKVERANSRSVAVKRHSCSAVGPRIPGLPSFSTPPFFTPLGKIRSGIAAAVRLHSARFSPRS